MFIKMSFVKLYLETLKAWIDKCLNSCSYKALVYNIVEFTSEWKDRFALLMKKANKSFKSFKNMFILL